MDFGTLLQTAKENEHAKRDVRSYSTKFSAPKKVERKDKKLSANIQKFLARKEDEERKRSRDANKKRDELLALRSQDKKATRRVNVMLKRTKSANQSVIEDAVDRDNTAVTLVGPSQPDEDDYGYVSQEAAAFYNKMMEKYNKMPDDPKFSKAKKRASSNLSSTKDRVKAALEREKEEAMLPHRRKRKHKEDGEQMENDRRDDGSDQEERNEATPVKVKPKFNAPPPMNFSDILKLAAQKQHEPIMIEVKPKEDEGPPMTKKQKREHERFQQWKDSKKQPSKMPLGRPNLEQAENRIPKLNDRKSNKETGVPLSRSNSEQQSENRVPKSQSQLINRKPREEGARPNIQSVNRERKLDNRFKEHGKADRGNVQGGGSSTSNSSFKSKPLPISSPSMKVRDVNVPKTISKSQKVPVKSNIPPNRPDSNKQKSLNDQPRRNVESYMADRKPVTSKGPDRKMPVPKNAPSSSNNSPPSKVVNKQPMANVNNYRKDVKFNGVSKEPDRSKMAGPKMRDLPSKSPVPKKFPPDDLKPKQFPPKDLKYKQFPPPDVRRKEFPPKDVRRKPPIIGNKRRILDDDEEYDSEMDDFIDDGPEELEDYSKYIKDIFGYDKSKYRGLDEDDVDNMESSFAQQMREDIRSTKLGLMEDLEDIKREKEEKKRKAIMKKRGRL